MRSLRRQRQGYFETALHSAVERCMSENEAVASGLARALTRAEALKVIALVDSWLPEGRRPSERDR
jgi:hypothetical protein